MTARRVAICFILILLAPCIFGKTTSSGLWLSVKIRDRYNPEFAVCAAIDYEAPLEIQWMSKPVRSKIVGQLARPGAGVYPLTFSLEEWANEESQFSSTEGLRLKLETPNEEGIVASSLFNDVHHVSVLLTKNGCK